MTEKTEADFERLVLEAGPLAGFGALALYTTYRDAVEGMAYNGEKIPHWDQIKWRAKWGWVNAYLIAKTIVKLEALIPAGA